MKNYCFNIKAAAKRGPRPYKVRVHGRPINAGAIAK